MQDNQSLSVSPGTIRGVHFQIQPRAQGKLVRCTAGSVFDVAVDLRQDSPTYGKWISVVLAAENSISSGSRSALDTPFALWSQIQ